MKQLKLEIDGRLLRDGEEICLVKPQILEYKKLENFTPETITEYCDWTSNAYYPTEISAALIGSDSGDKLILTREGLVKEYNISGGRVRITNLMPGKKYSVVALDKDNKEISVKYYFTTLDICPRMLRVDSVGNTRDMGGCISENGRFHFKYGMVFRGDGLRNISDEGVNVLKNDLHIKTELDVTGGVEVCEKTEKAFNVIKRGIWWYNNLFIHPEDSCNIAYVLRIFSVKSVYPIYFHCSLGRDRTGTVAFLLKGLCGMSETELKREHFYSFFSLRGNRENVPVSAHLGNILALIDELMKFAPEGGTLNDAIYAYVKHIGLTDREIDDIRDNLLEKV